jgi:sterol desaturase/sphingolipid hydroxylase (fatty acid hydroxylase superfamily)
MATLLIHAVALLVAAAVFTWIERRWSAQPALRWWQRPLGMDLTYWFAGPVLGHAALMLGLIVIGLGLLALLGPAFDRTLIERLRAGHPLVAAWPTWVQVLAAIVVADFALYWIHRAFHRLPFLWPLHAVHHSATRVDWLAAVRVHPLNSLISTTMLGVVLIACGFPLGVLAGVVPFIGLLGLLGHANVTWEFGPVLRHVFASPRFHRWHHTQVDEGGDRNFAAFIPLWDRLFGTWYLPEERLPTRFGIAGDPVPHHFMGQLLHPLRTWGTMVRRRCGLDPGRPRGWPRWLLVLVGTLVVVAALVVALGGPLATVAMQISLPRVHQELHLTGYRRGGPAPVTVEGVRFTLPEATARDWFMAAVGHGLPPAVAVPGSTLWGEVRSVAVGAPLPVQVVSAAVGTAPRLDVALATRRVNAWLANGARQDGSPWVVQLDAGSIISDGTPVSHMGRDLVLQVRVTGTAARRDGQIGLVRITDLRGRIDLRWVPGTDGTRLALRLHLDHLTLHDPRTGQDTVLPALLLGVIAEAVNRTVEQRPPILPFAVPSEAGLSLEVVGSGRSPTPAF